MKKTLRNLATAFAGESQARNRYTFYAKVAKNEGFEGISEEFLRIADQERMHAGQLFKLMQKLKERGADASALDIETHVATDFGDTAACLTAAIGGEHYERTEMYPFFAKVAEEEGLPEVAARLRAIANAESNHEARYREMLEQVQKGTVLRDAADTVWECRKCGYTHKGEKPPKECPACAHGDKHFFRQ